MFLEATEQDEKPSALGVQPQSMALCRFGCIIPTQILPGCMFSRNARRRSGAAYTLGRMSSFKDVRLLLSVFVGNEWLWAMAGKRAGGGTQQEVGGNM